MRGIREILRQRGLPDQSTFSIRLFMLGVILEMSSVGLQYNLGGSNCLDETISLAGSALMVITLLRLMVPLGWYRYIAWVSSGLFLFAKTLDVTRNIEFLNTFSFIGIDDYRSKLLQSFTYVSGALLLFVCFLRSHFELYLARQSLTVRNTALVRETEERRRIAEALVDSEWKLQQLINRIPIEVFWKDRNSVYLGCNLRMAAPAGLSSPAEIVGKTDFDLAWTPTEAQSMVESDQEVFETGEPMLRRVEMRHNAGGGVVWLETSKVPFFDASGEAAGVVGTSEDVTQRLQREAEHARLVTAIEQADESMLVTDSNGIILYVNPAFERITGYQREEALGHRPSLLKSGQHNQAFYEQLWDTIRRGEVWHGRFVNRRKDGTLYQEDATISPVRDEHGAIINYVALKRDVTKEVMLEQQLQHSARMEALGTLASGIAHDFRNILSLVQGYCELALTQTSMNEPAHDSVSHILRASARGLSLVRQIQTFTREEKQERCAVRLAGIVSEALGLLRPSIPPSIEIRTRIDPESGLVYADSSQIHQVVVNLCTNAYQSLSDQNGWLEVSVQNHFLTQEEIPDAGALPPGEYVCLTVSDNGHGMDEQTRQHIFEPFFTTKKTSKGMGLGLSIVHGIITGNGGAITLRSTVQGGTAFSIYLPRISDIEQEAPADLAMLSFGTERVLLIDDEEDLVEMTAMLLQGLGYAVQGCCDSEHALRLFTMDPNAVDVVVMDNLMPKLTGLALSRELLRIRPELPIVLMTGGGDSVTPAKAKEWGIRVMVSKPFSSQSLSGAIRQAIAGNP